MNTPIATMRWKHAGEIKSTHHVYKVPFRGRAVDEIEFYRKLTREEFNCFLPCAAGVKEQPGQPGHPPARWRMVGDKDWRTDDLSGALADGE